MIIPSVNVNRYCMGIYSMKRTRDQSINGSAFNDTRYPNTEQCHSSAYQYNRGYKSNTDEEYNRVPQVEVQWTCKPTNTHSSNQRNMVVDQRVVEQPVQPLRMPKGASDAIDTLLAKEFRHPGTLFLMRSNDDDDDEVQRVSVAAEQTGPTDQVSSRTPSGAHSGAAEEFLVRSEVGSQEEEYRDRSHLQRDRMSESDEHRYRMHPQRDPMSRAPQEASRSEREATIRPVAEWSVTASATVLSFPIKVLSQYPLSDNIVVPN